MDNNTITGDLNQIRDRQLEVIEDIDRLKTADETLARDLEQIQDEALRVILDLDDILKRRKDSCHNQSGDRPFF
jgi:hypothetical protein